MTESGETTFLRIENQMLRERCDAAVNAVFAMLRCMDERHAVYDKLNDECIELTGDFGPRVQMVCDHHLWEEVMKVSNAVFGGWDERTDWASYWYNESRDAKGDHQIEWQDGRKFSFKTPADVRAYIAASFDEDVTARFQLATGRLHERIRQPTDIELARAKRDVKKAGLP